MKRRYPALADPEYLIRDGRVLVDGLPVRNPGSLVRREASIVVAEPRRLRGEAKLEAALAAFDVQVVGRVALDAGAAAGGFVRALLEAGARRVYAVEAGHGQLLGSLRQDARVVNLERTNLGHLDRRLLPEPVETITLDLSYVALAEAVPQLGRVEIAAGADLVALVKPQFELCLAEPPRDEPRLRAALERASAGIEAAGWRLVAAIRSPVRGAGGAIEFFTHARKER